MDALTVGQGNLLHACLLEPEEATDTFRNSLSPTSVRCVANITRVKIVSAISYKKCFNQPVVPDFGYKLDKLQGSCID
ncbi:MAG: hypothetical protein JXQ99_19925 [Hyphomicrobiaceae bacterium]